VSRTREGWNSIPDGFGARFDLRRAPLWLKLAYRTPFLDRATFPRLVDAGLGYLVPNSDTLPSTGAVALAEARGWKVVEEHELAAILRKPRAVRPLSRN
jgi:hypothetical protein